MDYQPRHLASPAMETLSAPSEVGVPLGTVDTKVPPLPVRLLQWAFVVLTLAACAIPTVGMLLGGSEVVNSLEEGAGLPSVINEGALNTSFPRELGAYIEESLAFRNELISADAALRSAVFGVSNTKQVVVGSEGWIYYGGTLADFEGTSRLTDRELENMAFNLSLVNGYVRSRGAQLVVAIAPNKNTVYPEYMPYTSVEAQDAHDAARLQALLEERGIMSVDLASLLLASKDEGQLYYKRDSHWNDRGALIAYDALLDAAGHSHASYQGALFEEVEHVGDIDAMLYPVNTPVEMAPQLLGGYPFDFVGTDDVTASVVETQGVGEGSLLMYRDSFANNLIQPLSAAFSSAVFTNLVPYDFGRMEQVSPDVVIIERAERHLSDLDRNVAVIVAPSAEVEPTALVDVAATATVHEDGPYAVVEGYVDPAAVEQGLVDADTGFYVQVVSASEKAQPRVAFRTTVVEGSVVSPYGFKAYIPTSSLPEGTLQARVLAEAGDECVIIAQIGIGQEG